MAKANTQPIFGDEWLAKARDKSSGAAWVDSVIETLETSGQIYLANLRLWFNGFPAPSKDKQQLRGRLESFEDDQHLGGVNELSWWIFMQQRNGRAATVVPTVRKASRPDFLLPEPADCFIEVSTLNVSAGDRENLKQGKYVALNDAESLRRVIGKLTEEKLLQLRYAVDQKKPGVLVLFDYTEWSAYATRFFSTLAKFLLGTEFGFKDLPPELSAIVYVERKVLDGRIALSRHRSAAYYNPLAIQSLSLNSFPELNQFWSQLASSEPSHAEGWVFL